ncbi:enediyne biosynthesis protein [Actinoplanes sp. NPDC026623]|uniref:enediyne biosynthesis protein n=1 Tax=Actinoplanes sp. NPDC026623 TaxID=3155610 RepID=UPI0033D61666
MTATDSVPTTSTLSPPGWEAPVPPVLQAVANQRANRPPRVDGRDPRYLALRNFAISMSVFNILGYTVLGFEQPWAWPFFALSIGLGLEMMIGLITAWATRSMPAFAGYGAWGVYTYLLPAYITTLAVNMLLYANDQFWPIALAVVIGVGQKAVLIAPIKGRWRHFMNPSNFGIAATLVLFSWVNIAPPYHFTEHVPDVFRIMIPVVLLTAGTVLNAVLTKKVPLILGWLGAFVIQALLRWWGWDVALYAALLPMTGVAFLLFTNYMVTDPGTTPTRPRDQFMFGMSVGVVYGVLMLFNVVYTLFFATALVCLGRGAMWWLKWARERRRAAVAPAASQPA